ncbi:unnamed protein product [Peronospora belbahrii]|uniref:RPEL repeat protein n=1 Tax=Peronospora belbahrii TaxID=622444 RepID=A0AAU9KIJ2_9STRA|nr:unnamed protein product [Peronospora belbahrii]
MKSDPSPIRGTEASVPIRGQRLEERSSQTARDKILANGDSLDERRNTGTALDEETVIRGQRLMKSDRRIRDSLMKRSVDTGHLDEERSVANTGTALDEERSVHTGTALDEERPSPIRDSA